MTEMTNEEYTFSSGLSGIVVTDRKSCLAFAVFVNRHMSQKYNTFFSYTCSKMCNSCLVILTWGKTFFFLLEFVQKVIISVE